MTTPNKLSEINQTRMSKIFYRVTHAVISPPRLSRKALVAVLFSFGYALFVIFFPWEAISKSGFSDFDQYVEYFNYFFNHLDISAVEIYKISTFTEYFTHEVLWYELVRWLTGMTGEAAIALRIISFFILFVWSLFLVKRVSYGIALLFLFNPMAIDVAMSGIRNGLAWSLVIIGLSTQSKALKAVLFFSGMFIHSSTLVLVILYCFTKLASQVINGKILSKGILLLAGLGAGIFFGLALTVGTELVFELIGDRRLGENYIVGGGSFLQASLWAILLFFQCTSGRKYVRQNIFVVAVLAWYQTMNPFIPWSYRIWGAFLPVIAVSVTNLPAQKRQLFLYFYSGYLALQYLYWTKLFDYWYPA
jgi:hypothetical protein